MPDKCKVMVTTKSSANVANPSQEAIPPSSAELLSAATVVATAVVATVELKQKQQQSQQTTTKNPQRFAISICGCDLRVRFEVETCGWTVATCDLLFTAIETTAKYLRFATAICGCYLQLAACGNSPVS